MELKTLFIGIVFAMGIFAVKSGVGLHYLLTCKAGLKSKLFSLLLYVLVYLSLFMLAAYILRRVDIIAHFETIQKWLSSGMLIHVIMASGLMLWGLYLLKSSGRLKQESYGWIALLVPCPICITVIFISLSFLISYYPDAGYLAPLAAYLAFMGIVTVTIIGMTLWDWRVGFSGDSEATMGAAMMLIAAYFFLSVIIMPQFGNLDKIYRLAAYQSDAVNTPLVHVLSLVLVMAFFFFGGFFSITRKYKHPLALLTSFFFWLKS